MSRRTRLRPRHALLAIGALAAAVAAIASTASARAAADQTWPPFILVAGLLMIGVVAHRDGLFAAAGDATARVRAHPAVLLVALLGVVAAVTAVLNLDTSVAFLTPVVVLAARARGIDEEPFLYGTLLMSNAASLLLPGSNLTNLLVLAHEHVSGAVFAARMFPAWTASIAVTALFTVVAYHRRLRRGPSSTIPTARRRFPRTWSLAAVGVAVILVLVLRSPALPIFAVGVVLATTAIRRRALTVAGVRDAVDPASLAAVFALAVALGTLARTWSGPSHLVATASRAETAMLAAVASVVVNNLPAAVLFSSGRPVHPRALLLGLNLGPNLAVTGSLSALIWFRSARAIGARPSAAKLSRLGIVLVPLTIGAAGIALRLFAPASF